MIKIVNFKTKLIALLGASVFTCSALAFDPQGYAKQVYDQVVSENKSSNIYEMLDSINKGGRSYTDLTKDRIKIIASQGNTDAIVTAGLCELGVISHCGFGKRNVAEALKWFREGDSYGDSRCTLNLAIAYYSGVGVRQNEEAALSYFRKAANHGNAIAQYNLGMILREKKSLFGLVSNSEAKEWFGKSCDNGYEQGCEAYRLFDIGSFRPLRGYYVDSLLDY